MTQVERQWRSKPPAGHVSTSAAEGIAPMLLTPKQVANKLGVPERWVRRALSDGRLKKTKVGKYVRIHPNDYEEFIASTRALAGSR